MDKLSQLENLLDLEKASKDFRAFIKMTKPDYSFQWYHLKLIERLNKLPRQTNQRLLISLPPRTGKSELVSRRLPAWLLGIDPNHQIITTSYSSSLAKLFNRDVQRIMEDKSYQEIFPDSIIGGSERAKVIEEGRGLNKAKRTAELFELVDKSGFMMSVGRGGSVTGFGGHTIIIDDPIKNSEEADSETILDGLWEWYSSTIYSRLEGGGNLIVCNTRWSKRDLTGRLLEDMELHGGTKWEEWIFPAIKNGAPSDLDPRNDGDSIWPEKYTKEHFEGIRKRSPRNFSSLYQQHPTIQGGAIIREEWIQYYTALPFDPFKWRTCKLIISWDLNYKEGGGSYAVGVVLAKHENSFYLLDIYREKPSFMSLCEEVERMSKKYPNASVLIEEKANGQAILSALKKKVPRMIGINPEESKEERLHAISPIFEAKEFLFPSNHPLTKRMVAEVTEFPHSENDDIPDAISQGLNHFSEMKGLTHLRAMTKWY